MGGFCSRLEKEVVYGIKNHGFHQFFFEWFMHKLHTEYIHLEQEILVDAGKHESHDL